MKSKIFLTGGVIALTTATFVFAGCQQAAPQVPPDQAVKMGMQKLTTVTSHQFEVAVNGDLTGPQGQTPKAVKFTISLNGSADMKDLTDPKINLKLDGSGNADDQSGDLSSELRMNKDNLYFTLSKLDATGGQAVIPQQFKDMYVGKWWSLPIPPDTLKQFTDSLPTGGSQQTLTPEQQQLKDLFNNTQFFKNIKFVAMEDVKGEQSAHYTADLDKDAFMAFAQKAATIQGKPMADTDIKSMQDGMAKFDFTGNVWVGSTSGVMNQVSGDIKLTSTAATDPTGTISVRVTLWGFNQPVTVDVPAGAQAFPVDQLMGAMMGGAGASAGAGTSLDQSAMMDTSGMMTQQGVDTTGMMPVTTTSSGDNGTTTSTISPTSSPVTTTTTTTTSGSATGN